MKIFILVAFLLFTTVCNAQTAPTPSPALKPAAAPAPPPAPPFVNITQIIVNGGQFTQLLSLLISSNLASTLQGMINQSLIQSNAPGITVFAPTDAAFNATRTKRLLATLNSSDVATLVQYHVLQGFYSLQVLQEANNNVTNTLAGLPLNITAPKPGTVELSTGYDSTTITSTLSDQSPAGVFGIDAVLLPTALFGVPAPTPAPSPAVEPPNPSLSVSAPSSSAPEPPKGAAGPRFSPSSLALAAFLALLSAKFASL